MAVALNLSVAFEYVTRDAVPKDVIGTELLIIGVYICIVSIGTQRGSAFITPKLRAMFTF